MATVHGMDLDERLINVGRLYEIGYRHFSLGGMAARASQKRSLIESIGALKDKIRGLLPDAYIHVLGLSSPDYWAAFNQLAIDSCDGSSHFKQAFTGGAFFTVEDGRLVKHQAGRIDRETGDLIKAADVPECPCLACAKLRGEGIDTRYYGSNESNMGRAAHNLNMLMQAQSAATGATSPFIPRVSLGQAAIAPRIALVSCVGQKKSKPSPAFELYQSAWFRKCDRYVASQNYAYKFVVSAKHGLISESQVVEPYEQTLNDMPSDARKAWAESVFSQVLEQFPDGADIDIYAGNRYREYLAPLLTNAGYRVFVPLAGLGIGKQLAWFDSKNIEQLNLW
jgi:hypothetical protein